MSVFKAYDVRGKYPEQVNEELAYNIGRALVIYLGAKDILVSQDVRTGSKQLADKLMEGMMDQGASVTYSGLATSPMFYYFKFKHDFDAGVMVTASHLPSGYNGFKVVREGRQFMNKDAGFKDIEEMINSGKLNETPKSEVRGEMKRVDYDEAYQKYLMSHFEEGQLSDVPIIVDTSNGMAGPIVKRVLDKLGVDYKILNPVYNLENPVHSLNPLDEGAKDLLIEAVKQENAAFGAIYDADGDRVLFVDDKGTEMPGDYALALLAKHLCKPGDKVVHDLLCGRAFRDMVDEAGFERVESRVGHAFIKGEMVKHEARIGGEASGHMYLSEASGAEDTILCMLYMVDYVKQLRENGQQLSDVVNSLTTSWIKSAELNYEMESNEVKDAKIVEAENAFSDGQISHMDGVTVEYDDYWFNLRKSNTDPVLRLRAEARTKEQLDDLVARVEKIVNN